MSQAALGIRYSARLQFFDRAGVQKQMDAGTRRALSKAGAFVRRRARSSIRKRRRISEPGKPPSAHGPPPNLRTIYFVYEAQTKSVVVGPVKLNASTGGLSAGTVPATLELGGSATIEEVSRNNGRTWFRRTSRRRRPGEIYRRRKLRYKPRPFMGPAVDKERDKAPEMFRDVLGP